MPVSKKRIIVLTCMLTAALFIYLSEARQYLTFEHLRENRELLLSWSASNAALAVILFLSLYISTAFFVPGTLALTVAAGFFFGVVAGTFYSFLGAVSGATMAFLASRYLIGSWIQRKFSYQLETFNKEIARHGHNYLLFFRIVPVLPFFMVNYLAGITNIRNRTFIWTTAAGMLPGTLVCTFAGRQLGLIDSPEKIFSTEVITALLLLAVLIVLPPLVRRAGKLFV